MLAEVMGGAIFMPGGAKVQRVLGTPTSVSFTQNAPRKLKWVREIKMCCSKRNAQSQSPSQHPSQQPSQQSHQQFQQPLQRLSTAALEICLRIGLQTRRNIVVQKKELVVPRHLRPQLLIPPLHWVIPTYHLQEVGSLTSSNLVMSR